jgi:glycosyltransferase involved in cell wall biosynthesis
MRPLRILTWHIHGTYLCNLVQSRHHFYIPVKPGRPHGYGGRSGPFPWPDNLHEVPAEHVRDLELDCVLFQSLRNWRHDQFRILSDVQRRLPRVYLEHDPPRESPTDSRHPLDDRDVLLVHVTHYNALMWDSGRIPVRVVEHGVRIPSAVRYTGELDRGLTVVNNLASRGRRLGADIFHRVREEVPLELAGMGSEQLGGVGDVAYDRLHAFAASYRFLFNPIRHTSLGLAVCEAMMLGMPIIGLATTEMATAVQSDVSGWVDTNVDRLVEHMHDLLRDPAEARRLGAGARRVARERFSIDRFARDWDAVLADVTSTARRLGRPAAAARSRPIAVAP